jgi:hypothetical protein
MYKHRTGVKVNIYSCLFADFYVFARVGRSLNFPPLRTVRATFAAYSSSSARRCSKTTQALKILLPISQIEEIRFPLNYSSDLPGKNIPPYSEFSTLSS